MEISRALADVTTAFMRWLSRRKNGPERQAGNPEQHMSEALVRLAETSPHLLRDIGFRRDPGSGTPTREVWKKERLCIVVVRCEMCVDVQIDRPTARSDDAALELGPNLSQGLA